MCFVSEEGNVGVMSEPSDVLVARGDHAAHEDAPFFFPAGEEMLFGVLTRPTGEANGTTVTMLTGGGYLTSTHRNRMYVRLSRRLAALGYHTLRFDYHGTGESTGSARQFHIDEPFVEDLAGAIGWLEGQGLSRHVLVGSCFGSRTALACSPQIPGLERLVLLSPPARDVRYVEGQERVDIQPGDGGLAPGFLQPFRAVVERRVPILVVHGIEAMTHHDFQQEEVAAILDDAGPLVDVRVLTGPVHQLTSVALQDSLIKLVVEWLARR